MDGVRKSGGLVRPMTCHCCDAAASFVVLFLPLHFSHFFFLLSFPPLVLSAWESGGGDLGVGKAAGEGDGHEEGGREGAKWGGEECCQK